ncbi:MAG TPA: DUF2911 domain-containing protein [Chitinophagaceae bacterium]
MWLLTRLYLIIISMLFIIGCSNDEHKPVDKGNIASKDSSKIKAPGKNENPYADVDVSPMDMSYYPADYPKLKMTKAISTLPMARVVYSRPHLQGRVLFHNLLKYGDPWRLGANESTELDLYSDVIIQDKKIKEGRYILYCIPEPDNWTIILNSNIDSWGLQQDTTKDIARFIIPVQKTANHLEYYTMIFEKTSTGAELLMAWDNLEARLPFRF